MITWVQGICIITVLTRLVHTQPVLLVVDFATANGDERILSSLCLTVIFDFIHGLLKFSGVSYKGGRCYNVYGK